MLSYEVEQAVDNYKLPLIIAYVDHKAIAQPSSLNSYWPTALESRIKKKSAKAIHIPFIKDALFDAINRFSPSNLPADSLNHYTKEAHLRFGALTILSIFCNTKK